MKLEPCPFCGGTADFDRDPDGVPTLCEKFKPVSERQIRNWINAAIEQMREAHGEES